MADLSLSGAVESFALCVGDDVLGQLRQRLDGVRWPDREPVADWSQGVPLARMRTLVDYWKSGYDWRRCERRLNDLGQFRVRIDGIDIHFLHVRSPHEGAMPLILTHGWPGSVVEFLKCVDPLTDPLRHGGKAEDAFHLVIPSLPGFGFSGKPPETGWSIQRIARAWHILMQVLGYERYAAQGGDWGAAVTTAMGALRPTGLLGIHLNLPFVIPDPLPAEPNEQEAAMLEALAYYSRWQSGYSTLQASRPQTLGYLLADSPVGQAAWIYEKFYEWSDCDGDPANIFTADELLDNIMLYWLTNTGATSARLYWESFHGAFSATDLHLPVACSIFPRDIYKAPKSWAEKCMHNLVYWNELDRGGHFAAFEQPHIFAQEVRQAFRTMR
ncbi:epoxide hydrolase family protein [Sphingobium yanoikuyae]|uniref:epoxide hydrolase family protein n=1 Tax=Sphingobium yanoikuyae TaxID=13690 RepID=UPI001F445FDF|nr:epoxide hydrolase family protein [Sphingobium yanoikuyae]